MILYTIFQKELNTNPLVLKRGITDLDDLWNWYKEVRNGKNCQEKRDNQDLQNSMDMQDRRCKGSWTFQEAYPIKWTGPALKADSNTIAFESIELVHQGIVDS